ncbi:MAG TPA: hypothetical protein VIP77_19395 [Jiangellaceae bacterium]
MTRLHVERPCRINRDRERGCWLWSCRVCPLPMAGFAHSEPSWAAAAGEADAHLAAAHPHLIPTQPTRGAVAVRPTPARAPRLNATDTGDDGRRLDVAS